MKRLAKLTPEENKAWEAAFTYYLVDRCETDDNTDRLAWDDLVIQFPRLREFDGAEND